MSEAQNDPTGPSNEDLLRFLGEHRQSRLDGSTAGASFVQPMAAWHGSLDITEVRDSVRDSVRTASSMTGWWLVDANVRDSVRSASSMMKNFGA